jgi:hypothetical protein
LKGIRYWSSTYKSNDVKPVIIYVNADEDKLNILADNRNKPGIYR